MGRRNANTVRKTLSHLTRPILTAFSSLVDFEHWHPTTTDPINMHEEVEMQKWGIKQRPPPAEFWVEWRYSESLVAKR